MKNKTKKYRGSTTHGRGSMKKGRGRGEKGGSGLSGTTHKHLKGRWGAKKGFTRHGQKQEKTTINVGNLWQFEAEDIDLAGEGYDKLLGGGRVEASFTVTVPEATDRAIEKIEAAGGTVTTE